MSNASSMLSMLSSLWFWPRKQRYSHQFAIKLRLHVCSGQQLKTNQTRLSSGLLLQVLYAPTFCRVIVQVTWYVHQEGKKLPVKPDGAVQKTRHLFPGLLRSVLGRSYLMQGICSASLMCAFCPHLSKCLALLVA